MNNKKVRSTQWAILPILFCSAAVLAGDGGLEAPYGQLPPDAPQSAEVMDYEEPSVPVCESGNPARGACPTVAAANIPDTMQQARDLGAEADGFLDDATQTSGINTGYVGGRTRLGVGIDSEFKGKADLSHVFSEDENTAIIGQGYIGVNPKADQDKGEETLTGGGAKLNYHWVSKDEAGQISHVNKVFGAYDQNEQKDKKVTAGYGQERENMFWSGHVSKGISDKRDTGMTDDSGNIIYEKAYDWGVGGRVGTYLADQQMRIQGGLDYEWGTEQADNESKAQQVTLTGGVEKFFPDSPHSINANVDVYKKSGGYEEGDAKAEVRGGVGYRYDIASEAGIWQADKMYRRVRTEIPGSEIKQPAKVERKLVKHTMELEADTFFKVGSAKLTNEAQTRLDSVIAQMRECGPEGNIRITGNTCDVGSDSYNQKLSERRAGSVRDFMVKKGFPADTLLAQGLGESSPKYPNTPAERHKNRRVDVEYVCYQNEYKDQVVEQGGTTKTDPKVVWKQELIPTPPLWVRQALHNVADHKQRVDTYKTTADDGSNNVCTLTADDDRYTVAQDSGATPLNVMDGDNSCGKGATITAVGSASHGTVEIIDAGQYVSYEPAAGFSGKDTFTYTITDADGNTSTATVTIRVKASGSCSITADDDTFDVAKDSAAQTLNVLDGDESCDGSHKITSVSGAANGTVTITADAMYVEYQPNAGFAGTDTFTYIITSADGSTSIGTVTVNVTGNGGEPTAKKDSETTDNLTPVDIQVLANDSDPDGDPLKVVTFAQGNNGKVSRSPDDKNVLRYTPDENFVGEDSFTYRITDGNGNYAKATVRVTVTGNTTGTCPASLTAGDTISFAYSNSPTPVAITPSSYVDASATIEKVYINDSDASSETVRIEDIANGGMTGTVVRDGNSLTFYPSAGYCPDGEFTFYIKLVGCDKPVAVTITLDQAAK